MSQPAAITMYVIKGEDVRPASMIKMDEAALANGWTIGEDDGLERTYRKGARYLRVQWTVGGTPRPVGARYGKRGESRFWNGRHYHGALVPFVLNLLAVY